MRERRARQSSAEGDSYTPPKVITNRIKSAASASAVLAVMQAEHENPRMDLIAVAAAWYKLAQLQRSINAEVTSSSSFLMFVQRSPSFLEQPTGREVANILWATARLQGCASLQLATLWASLASAVRTSASQMNAQGIANSIWAVAKLATTTPDSVILLSVLPILANRVPAVVSEMTSQAVSNVIWATGQLSVDPSHAAMAQALREVLPTVVARSCEVLPSATPQNLANSCWGLVLSDHHDAVFLQAVSETGLQANVIYTGFPVSIQV